MLDSFCNRATACIVAKQCQRQWVNIDISSKAADLAKLRIQNKPGLSYKGVHQTYVPMRTHLGQVQKYNSPKNKKHPYGEQVGYCLRCETHFQPQHLTVDHILPRSKGGTDHITKLHLLSGSCNSTKGTGIQRGTACQVDGQGVAQEKRGQVTLQKFQMLLLVCLV